jgi:cytochrome c-type biogenesis protein CcmH/NrfG
MKLRVRPLIISLLLAPAAAFAADSGPSPATDPVLERAAAATVRKDWPAAQAVLKEAVAKEPGNPDYHNLYAHAVRKGANPDMNLVFKHYNEALRLDPKHRGAHEYIGEAYLMMNNVAKAEEHLAALKRVCSGVCEERDDLSRKIAQYRSRNK